MTTKLLRNQYAKMPGALFFSELTPPAEGATEEVKSVERFGRIHSIKEIRED